MNRPHTLEPFEAPCKKKEKGIYFSQIQTAGAAEERRGCGGEEKIFVTLYKFINNK